MKLYEKIQTGLLKRLRDKELDERLEGFKSSAFANLFGTVAEIGPGAGTNLKYLPKNIKWIGIEPNAEANKVLKEEIQKEGFTDTQIINGVGEKLPLADNSCDAVVGTLVLCSVNVPEQVLSEIKRVLKPGGRYIFVEHVAAPRGSILRFCQTLMNPFNMLFAGNCHVTRESLETIKNSGLVNINVSRGDARTMIGPLPLIWGSANK